MFTNLLAVIIAVVVVYAVLMIIMSLGGKYLDKKEVDDKEITKMARVIFKKHTNYIQEYIKRVLPGMKEVGVNHMNESVLGWKCFQNILDKETMETGIILDPNSSLEYKKLREMISTYVSFLVDKNYGGVGSSFEQTNHVYGAFLRENDLE